VKKHLLCLTVDTDPDGLSGRVTNRRTLKWDGLDHLQQLPEDLADFATLGRVPITWFVRADGQLESILGTPAYLLEKYDDFWTKVRTAGDELGWHPHLYRQARPDDPAQLIIDPIEAQAELERLWNKMNTTFHPTAFRNGEGWHTPETYATVERLGFLCDSTAIPGRAGGFGHPMNWQGAPNQPYFPLSDDLCMPRIRYMNPAVHPRLFANALKNWENACTALPADLYIWVMIFHPDEVLETQADDALYSRSAQALCSNLVSITESLQRMGHHFEWATVSDVAQRWRRHQQRLSA